MFAHDLTPNNFTDFTTVERICSTLSLAGCAFIAVTFLSSKEFHRPINRLVFFASMGNIFTNVATIIAGAAINHPSSFLCQFQAFIIQMFMPADAYWTFAMACNVYLTFYRKYDAEKLRSLEKFYFMFCYGIPFVPAFIYIFAKSKGHGRMYGDAALWCWIDQEWDVMRIATFYGPVWVVILLTMLIYLRAGKEIYTKRKLLRNFNGPPPDPLPIVEDPFQSTKTTEVHIISEVMDSSTESMDLRDLGREEAAFPRPPPPSKNAYTVTVSTSQRGLPPYQPQYSGENRYSHHEKPLDRKYSQPSSIESPLPARMPISDRAKLYPARRQAANMADNAAWSYTKVAVLFFVAMMVTWIPSSANRVYSVIHPGEISLGLEFASAFVLPLQGFWNALIYTTTSLPACRAFWLQIRHRKRITGGGIRHNVFTENREQRSNKMYLETDSMTELAGRPPTNGSSR